jgi:hypothetical protein
MHQASPGHSQRSITMTRGLSLAEVGELPAVVDLVTAGQALGLGRTKAYQLARSGQFPCPVIRAGKTYLVPTAGLLAVLGLPVPSRADGKDEKERRYPDGCGRDI